MQFRIKHLASALTLALSTMAGGVSATELAVIISNGSYDNLQGERRISRAHRNLVSAFKAQGYEVIEGVDLTRLEMQTLIQRVESAIPELAGIVVLCSTNTVTDGSQTWILPSDIDGDSAIEAAFGAPSLDMFLSLAAMKPGHGAVFLGVADVNISRGSNLRTGVGNADIPQGVLLVSGPSDRIAALLEDRLLVSDQPLSIGLSNPAEITVSGFVSPIIALCRNQLTRRHQQLTGWPLSLNKHYGPLRTKVIGSRILKNICAVFPMVFTPPQHVLDLQILTR